MGDEDGEKDYQNQLTNASRAQSDLLSAFRGSQFERELKPIIPISSALRRWEKSVGFIYTKIDRIGKVRYTAHKAMSF